MLCIVLLRGSFQLGFSFGELWEILKRGSIRVPIASSMWVIQNADIFLLSRFVSHKQIGLYTLASRTGFMVAFLPQGFRMALRPIRKTAVFRAYRQEYGVPVAQGQLLAYFVLITLTAVLAMVLGGEILIQIGGPRVRVGRPDRPADRGGDVDAGALPDREQHVDLPEQAAHLHHRDDLRRARLRGPDDPAAEPDRRSASTPPRSRCWSRS